MSPRRLGAAQAALVGLLAVATAHAAGHLVAGLLLAPAASPFLAVGNAAIGRTPTPVKNFAVAQFGTNDKLALLIGDGRGHRRRRRRRGSTHRAGSRASRRAR